MSIGLTSRGSAVRACHRPPALNNGGFGALAPAEIPVPGVLDGSGWATAQKKTNSRPSTNVGHPPAWGVAQFCLWRVNHPPIHLAGGSPRPNGHKAALGGSGAAVRFGGGFFNRQTGRTEWKLTKS